MPCVEGKSKYSFCINSSYYNGLLDFAKKKIKENDELKGKKINCESLKTTMTFYNISSAEEICKEFTLLHYYIIEHSTNSISSRKTFSNGDCELLNYWLNNKLSKSISVGDKIDVRGFYNEIKNNNREIFSGHEDLENNMKNIDPEILKNMELLYDLYDNERKILNILLNPDENDPKNNECSVYRKHCLEKYIKAINRCYGIYEEDTYNCRGETQYKLNDYDPVLEREEKKNMLIQGSTSFLMLILTFSLIYKFTPFGPFLQEKIKKVKNMWKSPKKNKEKLLSSMDIGNNISDNGKYKLAYKWEKIE
ncbi:hypothetical protein PVT01_000098700 [Plasmodium vivax]|uniref:VIR protein n=1 Tax=Plasmodium vivax TaxID=5855 RepID=A0A1G4E7Q2_PLAVI|nr:hypothetical protein PVT01_000098700 [Plasmodium vivax]